jgi:hypothetical protein
MNQELVERLIHRARTEQVVMCQALPDGTQLLAYPLERGALVALGFAREGAHRVQADAVLRKRAGQLARLGAWLPAMLTDGSWYVVRRVGVGVDGAGDSAPDEAELLAARELLA